MKGIFIYYSLSGNGDIVAGFFKDQGYDIRKVETLRKMPKSFILQILSGGFKASIEYKEKLKDFDSNIDAYDKIVIGSPIWNDRLSSPINTVINMLDLSKKNVNFVLYSGSGKSNHAREQIAKKEIKANIIDLQEPKKNKGELDKIIIEE